MINGKFDVNVQVVDYGNLFQCALVVYEGNYEQRYVMRPIKMEELTLVGDNPIEAPTFTLARDAAVRLADSLAYKGIFAKVKSKELKDLEAELSFCKRVIEEQKLLLDSYRALVEKMRQQEQSS